MHTNHSSLRDFCLAPIWQIPGISKKLTVPEGRFLMLWRQGRHRDEYRYWEAGQTARLSSPWERLSGCDSRYQVMLLPKKCMIEGWNFPTRTSLFGQPMMIVPIHLEFEIDDPVAVFQLLVREGKMWSTQDIIDLLMPAPQKLETLGEAWLPEELTSESSAQERFKIELKQEMEQAWKERGIGVSTAPPIDISDPDLPVILRVTTLQIGDIGHIGSFVSFQAARKEALKAAEFTEPGQKRFDNSDDLIEDLRILRPEDKELLKGLLYHLRRGSGAVDLETLRQFLQGQRQGDRASEHAPSSPFVAAARRYAQQLPGERFRGRYRTVSRSYGWPEAVRVLLGLAHILAMMLLILLFPLDRSDLADLSCSVFFGIPTFFVELYALLWVEERIYANRRSKASSTDPGIVRMVQALDNEARQCSRNRDWVAVEAHAMAMRDLARAYQLPQAEQQAEQRLKTALEKLSGKHLPIGKPVPGSSAYALRLFVRGVRLDGTRLEFDAAEGIPLGEHGNYYQGPGTSTVHLGVSLNQEGPWTWFSAQAETQPFQARLHMQPLGTELPREHQPCLQVGGLRDVVEIAQGDQNLPALTQVHEPMDLAIVLDGTMDEQAFGDACQLIRACLDRLASLLLPGRAKLIVFGDGPHGVGPAEYRPACREYGPLRFGEMLARVQEVQEEGPLGFQDYQRNVEIGLERARKYLEQSRWTKRAILVVGNSEPHPPLDELPVFERGRLRRKLPFSLYDWPSKVNWKAELGRLVQMNAKRFVVHMPGGSARSKLFWQRLGHIESELPGKATERVTAHIEEYAKRGHRYYQMDGPLYLPSTEKALEDDLILPVEA